MNDQTTDNPQNDSTTGKESPVPADENIPAKQEAAAESGDAPSPDAVPARRAVSWFGLAGLFVALLSAAGVAYLWKMQQEQQALNERIVNTQREFTARSTELLGLDSQVESLAASNRILDDDLAFLTKRIERQLDELPARMTRIEGEMDKIPGVAGGARSAWLLAEAEYYLRIANAQLNLAGNIDVALRALELADAKIKDLNDPGLTRVRAKISDERTALKSVPRPDIESIVLELGSLAQSLNKLPLAQAAPNHFSADNRDTTETGWRRAWRVIIDALTSIISIRRTDEAIQPLMTASEEVALIRSLDIELQIARVAAMRNQGKLYRQSLQTVSDRIQQYFDVDSQQVQAALAALSRLADMPLEGMLPDISDSLNLLLSLGDNAASP